MVSQTRSRVLPFGAILGPPAQKLALLGPAEALNNRTERSEEVLEQFVLERNDGFDRARIPLPGAATVELPVDARGIVKLGQNDMETADLHDLRRKPNIRPASRDVGRDRDARRLSRPRDDFRLGAILPRIEHGVLRKAGSREAVRSPPRTPPPSACRSTPAARLASLPARARSPDATCDWRVLVKRCAEMAPPQAAMRRDLYDAQPINGVQLTGRFAHRAGHAAELQIPPEEALIGYARLHPALSRHVAPFLGLDHLMQAALPI
jgi:hypothetical protein